MSDLTGELIDGRYQLIRQMATGGMASIYRALDLRLDRLVAVKIMHSHLANDEEYVARFIREAKAAADKAAAEKAAAEKAAADKAAADKAAADKAAAEKAAAAKAAADKAAADKAAAEKASHTGSGGGSDLKDPWSH